MSDRYKGAILSPTAPTVTPQSAGGIYTSSQQLQYQGQGVWPTAFNNPINNSLRFRSSASAYLNRTPASASNRTTWTWSGWVKRGFAGGPNNWAVFFAESGGNTNARLEYLASGQFRWFYQVSGVDTALTVSNALYRDPSAWYHVVFAYDSTQATGANRQILYVNGVQTTNASVITPAQNTVTSINNTVTHWIGRNNTPEYFDGYLTEINFIDGVALTPSSFGTTDAYGIWQPIPYTGAYGTNGFYLPFTDNSALTTSSNVGLGKDFSGNGNYWVTNNISITAGSTYDSMKDVPTNTNSNTANYCVLNPLDQHGTSAYATVADGNLYWYGSYNTQNGHGIRSTLRVSPIGKWYVEASNVTYSGSGNSCMLGFTTSTQPITVTAFGGTLTPWIGVDASVFNNSIRFYSTGVSASLADGTTLFATCASGDVVSFAIDLSAGKIWIGRNGTWYNSGNPATDTNATSTFTVGSAEWFFWAEYVASSDNSNRSSALANFGQRPFAYTPPSGFYPLNTYNLPTPTILDGDQYFNATTYTGTGSSLSITNSGSMQPDFVWLKNRSSATYHWLTNAVTGTSKQLTSNATDAESSYTQILTAFNSNGFTVGTDGDVNANGSSYVGWQWRASNAAGVSNTQGTITSTVSANTTAGFSIATFTIQSSGNATVGHGLGIAPSMIIIKSRSVVFQWNVYHASLGNNSYLVLNTTAAEVPGSTTLWNSTSPTSTVFSLGTAWPTYLASATAVAYCFAAVAGYSAFGSYTGNGSSDGPFIYTGFRPRFLIVKRTNDIGSWIMTDSARSTYNVTGELFNANTSGAEFTTSDIKFDYLSNGFKLREVNGAINASGSSYIYMAFAENPFKISRAR